MEKYHPSRSDIHFLARGIMITKEGNIILCRVKGKDWFFLPGGHVENGESVKDALIREIHEEIGDIGQKVSSFVGVCENLFEEKDGLQHELNIIFEVEVSNEKVESQKDHIEFIALNKNDIGKAQILPPAVKEGIIEWMKTREPFYKGLSV